jgi:hypothetical protein
MSNYVIGIGGTGAKCVESFIHLCAAGLLPNDKPLFALFVDPDGTNGSLGRAQGLLQTYYDCKQIKSGQTDIFKTPLRIASPDVWSPLNDKPPKLEDFFNYAILSRQNQGAAHLFDVLYSENEKSTSLEYGFRGHPSIGAAVMAATVKLSQEEPWATFRDQIALDVKAQDGAKVALFGSIFGGTGASGVPTIARLVSNEFRAATRFRIGGVLMLPYFSFDPVKSERMRVDAEDFLLSTQSALSYYHAQDNLDMLDVVYLMGSNTLTPVRVSSIGGNQQENEPHLLEMYAALAGLNFFGNDKISGYPMVSRTDEHGTQWGDLPWDAGFELFKKKLGQLARFAFAYLSSYHPMLEDISKNGRGYRAPWYVNLFQRRKVNLASSLEKELKSVKTYCESFLLWLANIEFSVPKSNQAQGLINYLAFANDAEDNKGRSLLTLNDAAQFRTSSFSTLFKPITESRPDGLAELWERMSDAKVNDANADGTGAFINALYRECGEEN